MQDIQLDVLEAIDEERTLGSVMLRMSTSGHPFASVTDTIKAGLAHNPVTVCVVAPPVHKYVNGAVPPEGAADAEPSHTPEQEAFLITNAFAERVEVAVSVTV